MRRLGSKISAGYIGAAVVLTSTRCPASTITPAGSGQLAFGQDESDQRLGRVHFETSCTEPAQRRFDRGMRYQHSFWYRQSKAIFEEVLNADPECAIAYWGIALSLLYNPHAPPPAENLPLGLAALQKAKAVGAKTQRERDYVDALLVFYTDYDKIDHRTRVQTYLKAMQSLAERYAAGSITTALFLRRFVSRATAAYECLLQEASVLQTSSSASAISQRTSANVSAPSMENTCRGGRWAE
jgi:hypothetical protein